MKKSLSLILIIILCLAKDKQCYAQNYADKDYYLVDSLYIDALTESDKELIETSLKEYHNAIDDTTKINALSHICENMVDDDWSKYQFFQYQLIQKALEDQTHGRIKNKLLKSLASALNNIGYIYKSKGELPKAIEYYHKSIKVQLEVKDKLGLAATLNNIGAIYNIQGDIAKSIEVWHKSLKILEGIGHKQGLSATLNNIGVVYNDQGEVNKALEYWNKCVEIRKEIGDERGFSATLNNIGMAYKSQGEIEKALKHLKESLKIREKIGDRIGIASSLSNIGVVYLNQGEINKSLDLFNKSLDIQKEIGDREGIINSLNNIGVVYKNLGNISKAQEYGMESIELAQEMGYPSEIKSAASLLVEVYLKQGRYKEALGMRNLEIQMRDSLYNEATQKATAQQEAKYEYEKQKTIDDAAHEKQIALEQEQQKKQRIISISIGAGLVLVVIFLLFVFNRLRVTRKQKLIIEQQRDEVEEAHKEIRDSINYAERIQRSFLATDELLNNNLKEFFVFFQPKDVVSGDFYWAGKLANNQFAVVNADSTGHGVPGAIMSILNISSIEKAVDQKLIKPSEIFNHTRDTIIERLSKDGSEDGGKDGMDASIIAFDFENNKFTYTAAQNPIWVIRNSELIEIKAEKMPIGKHDNDSVPFVGGEFETQKGDVVYTITDGFQDQFGGEKGKKFKVKPFKNYLISIAHLPMQEQKEKLTDTFTTWKGEEEQVDDVCVIGIRV